MWQFPIQRQRCQCYQVAGLTVNILAKTLATSPQRPSMAYERAGAPLWRSQRLGRRLTTQRPIVAVWPSLAFLRTSPGGARVGLRAGGGAEGHMQLPICPPCPSEMPTYGAGGAGVVVEVRGPFSRIFVRTPRPTYRPETIPLHTRNKSVPDLLGESCRLIPVLFVPWQTVRPKQQ